MIKIVTDSTAYLPESTIRRHDIRIVPLYVHFGEEAFKEGVELSHEEFYTRLREASALPTTSQPSAGEFHQVFKELVDEGHEVFVLTISSKLSGTWNSAMAAKEMLPGAPISVVDSLSTSVGLQLMVETAAEAVAGGVTPQELVDQMEEMKNEVRILFAVDTLEYLAKGGRIGNAQAFLGTLLKVKPILCLENGAIEPLEQVRTRRKALDRMLELVVERTRSDGSQVKIAVAHALAREEAGMCKRELVDRLDCSDSALAEIGPVIGTHTGPGVIGIAVCT